VKFDGNESFVFNSNKIDSSIVFENHIENTTLITFFIKEIKRENLSATEARFLPNAPTQNRPPDSRLQPNGDSTGPHHRRLHTILYISYYQSPNCQILMSVLSASYERRTGTGKLGGHRL
jgi:hypothetical protein